MAWKGKRTICEVLRELGDHCSELSCLLVAEEKFNFYIALGEIHTMLYKLHEATVMAKKMDKKLREHKAGYDEGMWEDIKIGGVECLE